MGLSRFQGTIENYKGSGVGTPEKVIINLDKSSEIDAIYDMIKNDETFILEKKTDEGTTSKLVVGNPLSSKLDNGELDIISESKT